MRRANAVFGLALLCCASLSIVAQAETSAKLRAPLAEVLERTDSDALVPVYFVLSDQLSGDALRAYGRNADDPALRRRARVDALKSHAQRTQARLRREVEAARLGGRAQRVRFLWIGNIVAADLTKDEITRLAALPEVAHVSYSPKVDVSLGPKICPAPAPRPLPAPWLPQAPASILAEIECGVSLTRAPEVWDDLGNTGEGAVIAVIDSGVCWSHSDIENQIWVNPGEDLDGDGVVMDPDDENGIDDDGNGYIDDLIGYDIDNGDNDPNDDNSHGSHVAGSVAGDGTGGSQTGMAPDAQIMVIRVGLQFSDEPDVWEAMQYAADNGADSISMSLGWPHDRNPDRATWRTNSENTIDAGTAMVIAAGNEGAGNEPDNVRTPGDVPRVITVGAVDCSDNIASFSSRGPVTWQDVPAYGDHPYPPGLTKPDVSGPGVNTKSHNLCAGYSTKSGTSMATPHVAGAVALMKSANPGLTHDDLKAILEDTSVDLGAAGKDNVYGSGRIDAYEAVLQSATSDGRISIKETVVACADSTLNITVSDADLRGSGTLDVDVSSDTEPDAEIVTLTETSASSGVFKGSIMTDLAAPAPDGKIQVSDADTVVATYIDADDGMGGTEVVKTDEATTDCRAPRITDPRATDIDDTSAIIRWETDENGDSVVDYGTVRPPDLQQADSARVTEHAIQLSGLAECTVYYYQVSSTDSFGNQSVDDNGGVYYSFETYGNFPDIGVQPCHQGQITLDRTIYSCSDEVLISVTDIDLNADDTVTETVTVTVTSTTESDGEIVTLTEDGVNSARFEGSITMASGPATAGDGLLQSADDDLITGTYHDADDGTGSPAVDSATSRADCLAATASSVRVSRLSQAWAEVSWDTNEPTTSRLEYGPDALLGTLIEDTELKTSHTMFIHGFDECSSVFFQVGGVDAYGNGFTRDTGNGPFSLHTLTIPGLYFYDGFETGRGGWVLAEEWEIGAPQGLGGSAGNADPTSAFSGNGVLGLDLSGQGSWSGDYEPNAANQALTERFLCSDCRNSELIFRRWLNAGGSDEVGVAIVSNRRDVVWSNAGATVLDTEWSEQRFDISSYADGKPIVQVAFNIKADSQTQYSGWNVDELIVKDGSLPDYVGCGMCDAPPSSGGLVAVTDPDACAPGGLDLTWDAAASWGTGNSGTYALYRGDTPGFTPDASTLIASGIAGSSYTDATAPVDQESWYLLRAENDETCADGPANGGVMDDNDTRLSGMETITRPPAASPGATLRLSKINDAHVRLEWLSTAETSFYRLRRSESPEMVDPIVIAETSEVSFDDASALTNAKAYFYRLVSVNPCGQETP